MTILVSVFQSGIHFDWAISLGNIITFTCCTVVAVFAWRDLQWRVKNLETWRKEHQIDANSRDQIDIKLGKIVDRLQWVEEARQKALNAMPGKRRMGDF